MKGLFVTVAALGLAVSNVSAHYIFQQLSIGSTQYPVYQYIRKNTNLNHPVTDLGSNDLRCNVGADGSTTDTVDVRAGDQFTFTLDTAVYHQGPVSIYMSKAPGDVKNYEGDGSWFKIKDWGPDFSSGSAEWEMSISYTYQIPTCIPDGEYLLRIQSLGIHNPWPAGIPQFYISCAQIRVTGGGNATPGPTALIPGAFKETDPGYTANIYSNFHSYTVPGPAVFTCGGSSGGGGSQTATSNPPTTTTFTTSTLTRPTTTTATTTTTTGGTGGGCTAAAYGQCGGNGWTGCTVCASGYTCQYSNDWYSQCL